MRRSHFLKMVRIITAVVILLPAAVTLLWSVTERWSWPFLLPESYTSRTVSELLFGSYNILEIMCSSIVLAVIVAVLATIVALMTARATEIYHVRAKKVIDMAAMLPLVVPGTAFAMGFQVTLIRLGLNDSIAGVVLVHLVAALPYSILIMTDVTRAVGDNLEEQAAVLGASNARAFFDVSIPSLMPGIISSASMAFILSYSQYFTTLLAGGGRIKTLALVLVPYIQSGDRALSAVYSVVFVGSALIVFIIFESLLRREVRGDK